jgi:hypothetical protein
MGYACRTMSKPTQILADKRARIAELEAAIVVERAELRGMEMMATLLSGSREQPLDATTAPAVAYIHIGHKHSSETPARGRQPGSISMRWRAVLWRLDSLGGNFSASEIVAVVSELEGRDMRPADARRQMELYKELGFVCYDNGAYNVTDQFRSKFAESADAHNENAPPSKLDGAEDAAGAHIEGPQE